MSFRFSQPIWGVSQFKIWVSLNFFSHSSYLAQCIATSAHLSFSTASHVHCPHWVTHSDLLDEVSCWMVASSLDPLLPPSPHSLPSTQQLACSLKMYHSLITYLLRILQCLPTHSKFEQKLSKSFQRSPLPLHLTSLIIFSFSHLLQKIGFLNTPSFLPHLAFVHNSQSACTVLLRCNLSWLTYIPSPLNLLYWSPKHGSPFNISI